MNKKVLFSIFTLFIILTMIIISCNNNVTINTKNNLEKYNELKKIFVRIKDNMDYISINNEELNIEPSWSYYKLDLKENTKQIYDYLIRDIRVCYIYFTDDKNTYSDSNFLGKFDNLDKVSKTKFDKLTKDYEMYDNRCLENFNKYYYDLLEGDEVADLKIILEPILLYKKFHNYEFNDYESILNAEYYKASLIYNITEYLKYKYDNN